MTTPQVPPLPLHPRRAQQLFQEVLLTDSELTPQLSEKSLPERLHQFQRLNLSGIQEAKRGTRFQCIRAATDLNPHIEFEDVALRLTKDGSTLQLQSTGITSVKLLDIKGIVLYEAPSHSFSFQFDDQEIGGDNNDAVFRTTDIFVASDADMLNRWVTTLTCGVNAFQEQQLSEPKFPDMKAANLVWQAVRLRIFELAQVIPLPGAIEHVTMTIPDQEYQQSEALRRRVQFLNIKSNIEVA